MKKALFFAFFFVALLKTASAETMPTSTYLLLPDSPFYFVKTLEEKVRLFLVRSIEGQAQAYLKLAELRLEEYKRLLEQKKDVWAEQALSNYEIMRKKAAEKLEEAGKSDNVQMAGARFGEKLTLRYIKESVARGFEALKNLIMAFVHLLKPESR